MKTVTGLFTTYDRASVAVSDLKAAGIPADDISILANSPSHVDATADYLSTDESVAHIAGDAEAGVAAGAVLGGAGGLLAGLGILAIPGIGPVVAGGWLVAAALGAATGAVFGLAAGGIVGALTEAGVPERDAHAYAEAVRRGGSLVTARVDAAHVAVAESILHHSDGVDISRRRQEYEEEGWSGFDDEDEAAAAAERGAMPAGMAAPRI